MYILIKKLYKGSIDDYKYVDKNTYKSTSSVAYGQIFYGGPRSRIFGINSSLQKIPLIKYTGREVFANEHFYYPFSINKKAKFCSYLLNYKFFLDDDEKYKIYNKDTIDKITFYDKEISILIEKINFKF